MLSALAKRPVHLWIYNHPFNGITDQVEFILRAFQHAGYPITVGRHPEHEALNLVIENFSTSSRDTLIQYCMTHHKRVGIIMTEHLDLDVDTGELFIHGDPLHSDNDYMHPAMQLARIQHVMECVPYIRCFFVLGDLPELRNVSHMLPGINVYPIPFPHLPRVDSPLAHAATDLVFTGFITSHRIDIHEQLTKLKFSVQQPNQLVSKKKRHLLYTAGKIILNIPQRETWRWLSPMRVIAGLRSGRATVSLGTQDTSQIASCCAQIDIHDSAWSKTLRHYVMNWKEHYHEAYHNYHTMADAFAVKHPFPHAVLDSWGMVE